MHCRCGSRGFQTLTTESSIFSLGKRVIRCEMRDNTRRGEDFPSQVHLILIDTRVSLVRYINKQNLSPYTILYINAVKFTSQNIYYDTVQEDTAIR